MALRWLWVASPRLKRSGVRDTSRKSENSVIMRIAAFLGYWNSQASSAVGHCSRVALGAAHSSWYWVLYSLSTFLSEQLSAFTPFGHCSANHHLRLQVPQPFNQSPNRCGADKVPIVMFFYVLRWPDTDPHHVPDLYKETPITVALNHPRSVSTSGRARKQLHTYKVQTSPPSAVAEAAETRANGIMKKLLLSLVMVLMVIAIQAPLTARSAPGEVTSAGKQFVELLADRKSVVGGK